jgi:hypothetical protein
MLVLLPYPHIRMMPPAVVIGTLLTCPGGIVMELSQVRQGFAG